MSNGLPQPFHPDASHINPDYRDGWNACIVEALQAISEAPAHTDHPARHWDRTCPACTEQEPVGQFIITERNASGKPTAWEQTSFGGQPLYAAPTRAWIGLTEDEVLECWDGNALNTARNFDAALKQKNTAQS